MFHLNVTDKLTWMAGLSFITYNFPDGFDIRNIKYIIVEKNDNDNTITDNVKWQFACKRKCEPKNHYASLANKKYNILPLDNFDWSNNSVGVLEILHEQPKNNEPDNYGISPNYYDREYIYKIKMFENYTTITNILSSNKPLIEGFTINNNLINYNLFGGMFILILLWFYLKKIKMT